MEETKKVLGSVAVSPEAVSAVDAGAKNLAQLRDLVTKTAGANITNLLDVILYGAVTLGVSDVHLEPQDSNARLRMRLDGILQDLVFFEPATYKHLLSRLKLMSKIKLNITDKPQDGRFSIDMGELLVEVRTSSLPSEYGESVVMRLLNPKSLISLEELGLRPDLLATFTAEINKPNGMIIVTGPTGSGKTTTLYAFLKSILNPEIKIITIEDPIEYHLKGVSQTQVVPEKGYTFSDGLRSIVRQDPDVILVGEIRDLETAKIGLQAALTGHLVLSTLHTNDAAGTIPRLVDLGTDASSIAPALKMAVAQRLVRKVCQHCAVKEKPTDKELEEIKKGLAHLPSTMKTPDLSALMVARAKEGGCDECNGTGYKGRKGLFEAFLVDSEIERFILTNPPVSAIRELAVKKGMVTMWQSGLLDICEGSTTFDEVLRVVEEDETAKISE